MSETDDGIFEIIRGEDGNSRVEFWTDGSAVKIGNDIDGDSYIHFQAENFQRVIDAISDDNSSPRRVAFGTPSGEMREYVIFGGYTRYVIDAWDGKNVLQAAPSGAPLHRVRGMVVDKRSRMERDKLAKSFVDSIMSTGKKEAERVGGHANRIRVRVKSLIPTVRRELVADLESESAVCDDITVRWEMDEEEMHYVIDVDTSELTEVSV